MFGTFYDFDRSFLALDELRRRMDRLFEEFDSGRGDEAGTASGWPRANLMDTGAELVLVAEVPGLTEKDISLTLSQDSLTLKGTRPAEVPEGYSVHRQERGSIQFARTFALPTRIDAEKGGAVVKHGLLTVTLPKAAEVRPRQISVRAS
jgi:HSP20 family protein